MINPINLENFFEETKTSILDEDKDQLEELIMAGMPDKFRRLYWLAITKAYGYLNHYGDGYYAALSSIDDKVLYPKWPHPDYPEINKDLNRIFAKEDFFQIKENLDKIKRILYAFCRRNPIYGYI